MLTESHFYAILISGISHTADHSALRIFKGGIAESGTVFLLIAQFNLLTSSQPSQSPPATQKQLFQIFHALHGILRHTEYSILLILPAEAFNLLRV